MTKPNKIVTGIRDILSENHYLVFLLGAGFILVLFGFMPEYRETVLVLGIAFIITSSVGIHMMLTTRKVAIGLHDRFNELNNVLRDIASTQNSILKEIASSQKEIASSQKEIASSQHNVEDILKRIEEKITVTPSG